MKNFSQLIVDSCFILRYFGPNFLLQLVYDGFDVRILCVIVQPPKPTFLLDKIWDGLTNRSFGVTAAVQVGVDVSTAFIVRMKVPHLGPPIPL